MTKRPLIAIIMDEDTSNGGRFYQTNKGYFNAIEQAGGIPIGIPYCSSAGEYALENCDGLVSTGARIKFPKSAYIDDEDSNSPYSDRFDFERNLIEKFVGANRPYLGICNGMQLLGVIYGAKMTYRIRHHLQTPIDHNIKETLHKVNVKTGTMLHDIIGKDEIITNSHHNEGILKASDDVIITAHAEDGAVEAIEIKNKKFAIGLQWHPELLWPKTDYDEAVKYASQPIFEEFIRNCK